MSLAAAASGSARADYFVPLIRVTCVPEAKYAEIETIGIYNVDVNPALSAQGFSLLSDVAKAPVTCALPQGAVVVEVVDYVPTRLEGMCSQVEYAKLRVSLGGQEVAFADETHGGCTDFRHHDIRISEYGVEHCALTFSDAEMLAPTGSTTVPATCKTVRLF
jgi:hypothetical protein